jgi:hypothetical protein
MPSKRCPIPLIVGGGLVLGALSPGDFPVGHPAVPRGDSAQALPVPRVLLFLLLVQFLRKEQFECLELLVGG